MQEQEKILKSLSNKKNQGMEHPSADRGMQEGDEKQTRDNTTDRVERSPSRRSKKTKNTMKQNLEICQINKRLSKK